MNPNSVLQNLKQGLASYFGPKVDTPVPIDQYLGKNAAKPLPKAAPVHVLPGENEWVAMMLNRGDTHTAADLHTLYKKGVTEDGGRFYGNDQKSQVAQPTKAPTPKSAIMKKTAPTASPTITPFPQNPLNGYVMGTPKEYIPIIDQAAQQTGMPTALLSALLAHESMRWNTDVIHGDLNSPVGAQGIGQFMPATAKGLGIDPLDPNQAIPAAAKYFMSHYNKYGRPDYALAGYNAGGAAVNQYGGVPPYPETQNYVKNILRDANTTYGGR